MAKQPISDPSQQLNVALSLPLYTRLSAHPIELEGRPHGAYSRLIDLSGSLRDA